MVKRKLALGVIAAAALVSAATAQTHAQYLASVASYKPMAAFDHEVGDVKFVGYFLAGPDRCDVTVVEARIDDSGLAFAPRHISLQIAAGGRSELPAGVDSSLAIACTAEADAIRIAPQAHMRAAKL
jgi:hypothetical protein